MMQFSRLLAKIAAAGRPTAGQGVAPAHPANMPAESQPPRTLGGLRSGVIGVLVISVAIVVATAPWPVQSGATAAVPRQVARPSVRVAIFGLVVTQGAAPVSGCRVQAFSSRKPHAAVGPAALTNAAGMFALGTGLRVGKYSLKATKGRTTVRVSVVITRSAAWYRVLHFKLPHALPGPGARRTPDGKGGVAVFGQVMKPDGAAPFAHVYVGAKLSGRPDRPRFFVGAGATNRMGLFALRERVGPGRYWIIADLASGHLSTIEAVSLVHLLVTASSRRVVVLRLRAGGGSVTGRVADGAGRPVARASVMLETSKQNFPGWQTDTDANGRYSLRYVPFGTYIGDAGGPNGIRDSGPRVIVVGKRPVRMDFRIRR
jgi:hypothetical protein